MADGTLSLAPIEEARRRLTEKIRRELGPEIEAWLKEPDVLEVLLNPDGRLWVERFGQARAPAGRMEPWQAESLFTSVASSLNTQITREKPTLEGELPLDGSRFTAALPPIVSAPIFTIRRKASRVFTLADYVAAGTMTEEQRAAIEAAVLDRQNILIAGGTSSGKTTLANAILDAMRRLTPNHRFVICEDTAELQSAAEDQTIMRSTLETPLRKLIKLTLRLTPDRIVVGEVRDGEAALEMLKAWNTGHPGGTATVHANDALAALARIESLLGEVINNVPREMIAEAINVVVVVVKTPEGHRQVKQVLRVNGWRDGVYQTQDIKG